ncbi:MAG: hypothetical protein U0031_06310 [Thermomicrobiales bacterium]
MESRFDLFTRYLSQHASRRDIARGVGVLAIGALTGLGLSLPAEAKSCRERCKNHCNANKSKRKCRKHCQRKCS